MPVIDARLTAARARTRWCVRWRRKRLPPLPEDPSARLAVLRAREARGIDTTQPQEGTTWVESWTAARALAMEYERQGGTARVDCTEDMGGAGVTRDIKGRFVTWGGGSDAP